LGTQIGNGQLNAFAAREPLISQEEGWGGSGGSVGHSDYDAIIAPWDDFSFQRFVPWLSHAQSCVWAVVLMFFIDLLHRGSFLWKMVAVAILMSLYGVNYALWRLVWSRYSIPDKSRPHH